MDARLITIDDVHQCIAITECMMMHLFILALYSQQMKARGMKRLSYVKGKNNDKYPSVMLFIKEHYVLPTLLFYFTQLKCVHLDFL